MKERHAWAGIIVFSLIALCTFCVWFGVSWGDDHTHQLAYQNAAGESVDLGDYDKAVGLASDADDIERQMNLMGWYVVPVCCEGGE